MACNCASTEQINKLYEKYGSKQDTKKLSFGKKVKYYAQRAAMIFVMLFITPFLLLYVLYKGLFDDNKKISIKKMFKLKNPELQNVQ